MDYEERALIPYSSDIQYLKAEGEFRPFRPETLAGHGKSKELTDEFISIIASRKFQNIIARQGMRSLYSRIHRDKVSDDVLDNLEEWGLTKQDNEDGNTCKVFS